MKPLLSKRFKLERYPGKGGWTYARLPILHGDAKPSAWPKVKGSIDGYLIKKVTLMSTGNGFIFFPVKAEIRKKIAKAAGDNVMIILYPDTDDLKIPADILACLQDEPKALKFFNTLTESQRNYYITWVTGAKRTETKFERLVKTVNRLSRGLKMYDVD